MKTGVRYDRLAPILLALPAHRAQGPSALTYINRVSRFIVHHTEPVGLGTSHAGQVSEGIRIFFLLGE